ncbi:MAG: amidohydrolase family protein [Gemmatimonadota bacterium]
MTGLRSRRTAAIVLTLSTTILATGCDTDSTPDSRTIFIETSEATAPDVALSPDGQILVFSLLGHLFRLPITGGVAEQLTFGPFYAEDPAFSPDGTEIAFASDRGAGEENLFVMTFSTGEVRQVTDEFWAARPVWATDSESLLYLSYAVGSVRCAGKAGVRRVGISGGDPEVLTDRSGVIRSLDVTDEGWPTWVRQEVAEGGTQSVIEALQPSGLIEVLGSVEGRVDRMDASPRGEFWVHRSRFMVPRGELIQIDAEGRQTLVADITRGYCQFGQPRFAVSADGESVFIGEEGKLWRYNSESGTRDSIPFIARVEIPLPPAAAIPEVDLAAPVTTIEVTNPQRAPDDGHLLFGALGKVWWQEGEESPAEALTFGNDVERDPVLTSDGVSIALIDASGSAQEIVVIRRSDGQRSTLLEGDYFWDLAWHPDGRELAVSQANSNTQTFQILSVDVLTGRTDTLIRETGAFFFPPNPHYSLDGSQLFYTAYEDGLARLYALNTEGEPETTLLAALPFHLSNIQVSPRLNWIGFRRNSELWIAPLPDDVAEISEKSALRISGKGGRSFRFSGPETVIYSDGGGVWEYDIPAAKYDEIPMRLAVPPAKSAPLLIERIRLLDFQTGDFTEETSVLLRDGRIDRVGDLPGEDLVGGVERLDAAGRFAIPGLIEPHMHVEAPWWLLEVDQSAYIANGVTTVRDVGEPFYWAKSLAQRSKLTGAPLPRYMFTGEMLQHYVLGGESGGSVGYAESSMLVYDEETTRRTVREHRDQGVHAIKAYASLPMNLHRAVAEEARVQGLPVIAHGTNVKEIVRSVLSGYSFVEHLNGPSRFYDDIHQLLAAAGTNWTPTLSIMGGTTALFLPPEAMESDRGRFFRFLQTNELGDLAGGRMRSVNLLIGTDNPGARRVGASHHTEMQSFVLAGFTPLEVLEMATLGAAEALGIDGSLGTLDPGKLADLVILDANPLEDVTNTRTIWRVMKDGWLFDPAELQPEPAD